MRDSTIRLEASGGISRAKRSAAPNRSANRRPEFAYRQLICCHLFCRGFELQCYRLQPLSIDLICRKAPEAKATPLEDSM